MIETSTRTIQTFAAVCSSCGSHGPEADGEAEAIALAKDEGWQHWTVHKESECIDVFRCTKCYEWHKSQTRQLRNPESNQ